MLFNNDKKNLPEDLSGQRIELSLDDLNQVTGGISSDYFKELAALNARSWDSRDAYIAEVDNLIKKYQGQ